ncbi:MAG: polyribonucleotide nucleotidyltransferase [Candidatus Paceibacterota bacterium]|jgi:polyribonucleotide nucleotidyltransferase|nr:polyribonucleotide nucleotidyltransferase [Candidatus Paceibacterota bacterium]
MQSKEYSVEIGGKKLVAQFTDLADQTNGSVIISYGDTMVLATAVIGGDKRDGIDYLPLTVDYEDRFYATGKILGSRYVRREGKPSSEGILSGRVVDRTIRPLFDQHIRNEIQVVITILAMNGYEPDVLAVSAASLALATSDIPFNGPVSSVRLGKKKGSNEFIVNPSNEERESADYEMDMTLCGKDGNINMIELGGKEITEDVASLALQKGKEEIEKIQNFQKMIIKELGKTKMVFAKEDHSDAVKKLFADQILKTLKEKLYVGPGSKVGYELEAEWGKMVEEKLPEEDVGKAKEYFHHQVNELLHKEAIKNNCRPDGRGMDELRNLSAQAGGISPILHGTGVFYRGGTHVLSVLTLGGPKDSQTIDGTEKDKTYMHHYNFPPYSGGETGRMGGTNRRMIGHGALAEKALIPVLPNKQTFPYTIRVVSESMASNGSTSMASVCGSTLALMDGGVPIKAPVAGIAMGLMMEDEKTYKILMDIQGPEDHHGDMDLKVAGTREGITAIQMDVKVDGIPVKILSEAFVKAKTARFQILDVIEKAIPAPRADIASVAPKILVAKIQPDQIGGIIGPGGKVINKIREATGSEIDIEEDGTVFITGKNGAAEKAKKIIEGMTHVYKAGERYTGVVTKIIEIGAFVKIGYNTEGLVHISEIAPFRVNKVSDIIKEGDTVPVIVKEIDERSRLSLSIRKADPDWAKKKMAEMAPKPAAPTVAATE